MSDREELPQSLPVRSRCSWAGSDPVMIAYHDHEWGVPCHDDRELFERLTLEGFQAGLSWSIILHKREGFRTAFRDFDFHQVAEFDHQDIDRLLADRAIVRNRLKIAATIRNARASLAVIAECGSLDRYLWSLLSVDPRPRPKTASDVPARTTRSDQMSKAMKQRGFTFVGSTICYAFMQSVGMVDDHLEECFRATA